MIAPLEPLPSFSIHRPSCFSSLCSLIKACNKHLLPFSYVYNREESISAANLPPSRPYLSVSMLFPTAQLALLLASLQYVRGMPTITRATENRLTKRVNDCGASDFTNASSSGSPSIADCQQIAANIAHGGSFFITAVEGPHTIASSGSCAFEVQTSDFGIVNVGNEDIIDLINQSIAMFAAPNPGQTFIGASGQMGCQTVGHTAPVIWAIIRN